MKSVFISHSRNSKDALFIQDLVKELRTYEFELVGGLENLYDFSSNVINYIKKCNLFIAVITSQDPNIFFEVGYALGGRKQVLIVCSPNIDLPPDLANVVSIRGELYDTNILFDVVRQAQKMKIQESVGQKEFKDLNSILQTYRTDPEYFDQIEPLEFERMIQEWFRAGGFDPKSHSSQIDEGYDFFIEKFKEQRVIVEVKKLNRSSRLSIGQVQKLMGAVYAMEADAGILISTAEFTSSAKDFAERCKPRIELWDMDKLLEEGF